MLLFFPAWLPDPWPSSFSQDLDDTPPGSVRIIPVSDWDLVLFWECHAKRSLTAWVGVIPKEGRARVAAPFILLAWHRLFRFFLSIFDKFWTFFSAWLPDAWPSSFSQDFHNTPPGSVRIIPVSDWVLLLFREWDGDSNFWAHLCMLHGGLICVTVCLSVCPSVGRTGPKVVENNSYLGKYCS